MGDLLKRRVEERLAALNTNAFEAARAGDLERNFINDILNGKKQSVRGPNLLKLAKGLRCSADYLIREDAPAPSEVQAAPTTKPTELLLPVRYEVAAGGFLLRDDLPQRPYGFRKVAAIPPYELNTQWLERVVSDSMNRLIPEESTIHVVDAKEINLRPTHGAIVVVERTRAQGSMVERTVKQIEAAADGLQLCPRSHNPRWNKPIPYHEGIDEENGDTVEIVGLVLRSYQFFTADDAEEFEPDATYEESA